MGDMKRDNPWSINWESSVYLFLSFLFVGYLPQLL